VPIFGGGPSIFQMSLGAGSILLFLATLCIVGYSIRSYISVILVAAFTGLSFFVMLVNTSKANEFFFKTIFKRLGIHEISNTGAPDFFGEGAYLIVIGTGIAFLFAFFASFRDCSIGAVSFQQRTLLITMLTLFGTLVGLARDSETNEPFFVFLLGIAGCVTAVLIGKMEEFCKSYQANSEVNEDPGKKIIKVLALALLLVAGYTLMMGYACRPEIKQGSLLGNGPGR